MKKKKLSEINVNATLLGNNEPGYYNHRLSGLGGSVPVMSDANNATNSGFYQGSSLSNANYPTPTAWYLLISMPRSSNSVLQIAIRYDNFDRYCRSFGSGAWTGWTKL